MKATEIKTWPGTFSPSEWPDGTLQHMSARLFTDCIYPLRRQSGIPMWPSALLEGHVRESGDSWHSTKYYTRLSEATDMHVKTFASMVRLMCVAETISGIGGIGIYFNTNTPMVHIDHRPDRLVWLSYDDENGKRIYLYRENNYIAFYKKLGELLA